MNKNTIKTAGVAVAILVGLRFLADRMPGGGTIKRVIG